MYYIIIYSCRYNSTKYYFIQTILHRAPQFVGPALVYIVHPSNLCTLKFHTFQMKFNHYLH